MKLLPVFKKSGVIFTGLFCCLWISLQAQKPQQVKHLKGTKTIGGIQVTVTEQGFVDSLYYCGDDTGPYFAGNDYSKFCCNTGSYIFNFSTPVYAVYLNISAVSTSSVYDEEIEIYVNGKHHMLTNAGDTNYCEPKLIISEQGNLRPCEGCYGAGADHIKIEGPVSQLKVTCKINFGQPQGAVFGVFFDAEAAVEPTMNTFVIEEDKIAETGARKEFIITTSKLPADNMLLENAAGKRLPLKTSIEEGKLIIDAARLAKGTYYLYIEKDKETEKIQLIVR